MKHARRRIGSLLLACALILTLLPVNALAEEPDTWDGSADTTWYNGSEAEFTITSAEELAGLAVLVNNGTNFSKKTIQLSKSLDLSGANWTPIGMSGKRFQGTFDGAGHTITGMRAINNLAYGNGFFGDITGGAVIKNLTFNDARVARYDDTRVSGNVYGIVCGYAYGTVTFENIHVRASSLTGYGKAGAILGMAADPGGTTILKNCTVESTDIYVAYNGGGLIGLALNNVALENCATVNVEGTLCEPPSEYTVLNTIAENSGKTVPVSGTYMVYPYTDGNTYYYAAWGDLYTDYHYSEWTLTELGETAILLDGLCHNQVAQAGNRKYATLDEAIDAAQPEGTVQLLRDITLDAQLVISGDITINGNGKTITYNSSVNAAAILVDPNASLTLNQVNVTTNKNWAITGTKFKSITIHGGIFNGGLRMTGGELSGPFIMNDAVVTAASGTYSALGLLNINCSRGVLTDVTADGGVYTALYVAGGNVTVTGGTYTTSGTERDPVYDNVVYNPVLFVDFDTLHIASGNFVGTLQKESSADLIISGGYFTADPSDYVAAGKTAVAETTVLGGVTYSYAVKDQTISGDGMDTTVSAGTPSVTVPEGSLITEDELKDAMSDSNANLADAVGDDLRSNAEVTGSKEEAVEALENSGIMVEETTAVTVVVEPYLEVTVADHAPDAESLMLEITPYYNVKATTASAPEQMTEHNTVTLKEQQPMEVTAPVEISIPLPGGFPTDHLYVKHTKGGRFVAYHEATVSGSLLTFTNDKGFSTFEIKSDPRTAAVRFDGEIRTFRPSDVGGALPAAAAPEGKVFAGWSFAGVSGTYTTLTDELLTQLGAIGGTVSATAVFRNDGSADNPSDDSDGGSGSGSTGSSSHSYSVSVPAASEIRGGSITVTPRSARKGDTVTITVKPDAGYVLDTLTVTERSGGNVKLTHQGGSKYTFTMPAGDAAVSVRFRQADQAAPDMDFADVAPSFWAYSQIRWAFEKGYMNGTSATTFNPGGTVSRQQVWMILARMSGAAPADMAAAKTWAVNNGISDGTNPGGAVSRQQLVALLYRFADLSGYDISARADLSGYPDRASLASYASDAMAWAVAHGIIGGTVQGTLNAAGASNRAQLAVILWRFHEATAA